MINLYQNGGFFWFNGVVEDRNDPLLLGRCRVRIVGYHNPNKTELPTEDLPWAFPMQSITSAAMNGIGTTPLGPVEGTWVLGFFRDGDDCQEPVIMGTFGGIPQIDETLYDTRNPTRDEQTSTTPPAADPQGHVYVNKSTGDTIQPPSPDTVTVPTTGIIGPLTQIEVDKLTAAIASRESGGKYNICNQYGYIGAYQIGADLLADFGYIRQGAFAQHKAGGVQDYALVAQNNGWIVQTSAYDNMTDSQKSNFRFFCLATDSVWTEKAGGSATAFINNKAAQDAAMLQNLKVNYRYLYRTGIVTDMSSKGDVAGYLAVSHLLGPGGAKDHYNGVIKTDANNTTSSTYFNLGFKAVGGAAGSSISAGTSVPSPDQIPDRIQPSAPPPAPTVASLTQNTDLVQTTVDIGFADPNKVYPKTAFIGEPDTNRLARHQKIALTVVGKKDAERMTAVETALDMDTWDQPPVPYNAAYPYNHVVETESGHILEFDDTAGNERIHQYHKSGTFTEIDVNGTRVTRIVGDDYTILERNGYVYINGKATVTVGGTCSVKVVGDCNLEVDGSLNTLVHNDANIGIAGSLKLAVGGSIDIKSKGTLKIGSDDEVHVKSNNDLKITSSDKMVNVKAGSKVAINATTELGLKSGEKLMLLGGGILALDGSGLALMSGFAASQTSASSADDPSAGNSGDKRSIAEPQFPTLVVPTRNEEFAYVLDSLTENLDNNADAIKSVKAQAIADGTVNEEDFLKQPTVSTVDTKKPVPRAPVDPGCAEFSSMDDFSPALQLSDNFTLGHLSSQALVTKVPIQELHGLSKSEIVCNLYALATQVLDPIRVAYPHMVVTSGFRTPIHSSAVNSQHEFGCAADMQFLGVSKSGYLEIAQWIRDNVPFDQLLLEFKSFGSSNPWIHVSYSLDRLRADVRTMWNDQAYPDASTRALVDLSGGA